MDKDRLRQMMKTLDFRSLRHDREEVLNELIRRDPDYYLLPIYLLQQPYQLPKRIIHVTGPVSGYRVLFDAEQPYESEFCAGKELLLFGDEHASRIGGCEDVSSMTLDSFIRLQASKRFVDLFVEDYYPYATSKAHRKHEPRTSYAYQDMDFLSDVQSGFAECYHTRDLPLRDQYLESQERGCPPTLRIHGIDNRYFEPYVTSKREVENPKEFMRTLLHAIRGDDNYMGTMYQSINSSLEKMPRRQANAILGAWVSHFTIQAATPDESSLLSEEERKYDTEFVNFGTNMPELYLLARLFRKHHVPDDLYVPSEISFAIVYMGDYHIQTLLRIFKDLGTCSIESFSSSSKRCVTVIEV